eukprot:1082798-Pleurochrysis_carterae.AAC.1
METLTRRYHLSNTRTCGPNCIQSQAVKKARGRCRWSFEKAHMAADEYNHSKMVPYDSFRMHDAEPYLATRPGVAAAAS